ncbi:hypothetical protein REPUB_Repub15cG0146400 [Reevesia pubescens]
MGLANENKSMDEISVLLRRFGDEQSTLLDQFERRSVAVQLNQAILGRSLSESSMGKRSHPYSQFLAPPPPAVSQPQVVTRKGRRGGSGFNRVLKKLLKSILGRKGNAAGKKPVVDPKNPMSWKAFSRSLRY